MTAHELAKALLALADKPVRFVVPAGEGYVKDLGPFGGPWEDLMGCVRIQCCDDTVAAGS